MLVLLPFVVRVPAGAVDKVEIERHFDESHATLNQTPRQQTTLSKLSTIALAQAAGLVGQLKCVHELPSAKRKGFLDHGVIVFHRRIVAGTLAKTGSQPGQQLLTTRLPRVGDAAWPPQANGSGLCVDQIDVTVLRSEKTGASSQVRVTHHDVRRHALGHFASLIGNDGTDRRIDDRPTDRPPRVHSIGRCRVLVLRVVIHGPQQTKSIENLRTLAKVLRDLHTGDGGVNGRIR